MGQWAKCGLSGGEFATQLGVKEGTLRHWKWQLGRKQTKPSVTPAFFEAVPVASVGLLLYRQSGSKLTLQTVLTWIEGMGTPL